MNYIEYNFEISPKEVGSEILVAELGEVGFESFVETDNGVLAYIQQSLWNETILEDIFILQNPDFQISYQMTEIEQVNWNQEWEKNFTPIQVDGVCTVRATFHPKASTPYEIVIDPKMSFGTGHHETTYMMLQFLLKMDLSGKKVLDMGCGTGILAIMAAKKGASEIQAIDIDPWCYENAKENIILNDFATIEVKLGDASLIENQQFDLIIANINRNILLEDIPSYVQSMNTNAEILLSGFYEEDFSVILEKCNTFGLTFIEKIERNNWVAVKLKR